MAQPKRKEDLIIIIDGYGFTHDRMGYTLCEYGQREACVGLTKVKSGEMREYVDTIGYFSNVKDMMNSLLNYATKRRADKAGVKNIGDFIAIMVQIKDELIQVMDRIEI